MLAVAGICAAAGFGAVYAIVGGGDNRMSGVPAAPSIAAAPSETESETGQAAGLANEAKQAGATQSTAARTGEAAAESAGEPRPGVALRGRDGRPLNRGKMTTFVFKKQPAAPSKDPEFEGPQGKTMTLADLKGKVILLNLWATWCGPCRKEMPHLDELQAELGSDQFEVVALSIDRGSAEKPKRFLEEVGAKSLKFYHDPEAKAGFALMAIGMPTTILLDRQGREIGRLVGPAEWHSEDAKMLVRAAIAAG